MSEEVWFYTDVSSGERKRSFKAKRKEYERTISFYTSRNGFTSQSYGTSKNSEGITEEVSYSKWVKHKVLRTLF